MSDVEVLVQTLATDGGVDLHTHTRHSDGAWSPEDLVADAQRQGVRVLAVTDHDTVAGVRAAQAAGAAHGLAVIGGVEVTTALGDRVYHLLCYDIDPAAPVWAEVQAHRQRARERYYGWFVERLRERGYVVSLDLARDAQGELLPNPVLVALERAGYAPTPAAARQLLASLNLGNPFHLLAMPVELLGARLRDHDGLCAVAHPARQEPGVCHRLREEDLVALQQLVPLVALEAYHPYHTPADIATYTALAQTYGLAVTCGSDAHGWHVGRPPKPYPAHLCRAFLERVLDRWRTGTPASA